jgi:hypothetical protein
MGDGKPLMGVLLQRWALVGGDPRQELNDVPGSRLE